MSSQPPSPGSLNEHARKWLEKLPDDARPKILEEKYPRIINRISSLWKHPDELMEYLDELLVDTRGGRAGFPMSVATELVNLKDFYDQNIHPDSKSYLWDPRNRSDKPIEYERAKGADSEKKDEKETKE